MNKKLVMALVLVIITVMCAISFTACNDSIVYDAGEYGDFDKFGNIQEHTGYKFIGWDKSGKQGIKKLYKAQYERIEYYLTEEKDIYICPQGEQTGFPINYKITDMQTMQVKETGLVRGIECSATDERISPRYENSWGVYPSSSYIEFDGILTLIAEDAEYNIRQEFNLHVVRNRIKAESVEIYLFGNENTINIGETSRIYDRTLPENTSFREISVSILEVIRNGKTLSASEAAEIAKLDGTRLKATEKAQVGDIIRVQAYNERDPEVKSNILTIFVTED